MSLSREDVEKIALLSRLQFTGAEFDTITQQLGQIVDYVAQLDELSTEDVTPMAHAGELTNVLAADEVRPSLPREQALANAPKHDDECYRVPAVLGE